MGLLARRGRLPRTNLDGFDAGLTRELWGRLPGIVCVELAVLSVKACRLMDSPVGMPANEAAISVLILLRVLMPVLAPAFLYMMFPLRRAVFHSLRQLHPAWNMVSFESWDRKFLARGGTKAQVDIVGVKNYLVLGPMSVRMVASATSSPFSSRMVTQTGYSRRSDVSGTGDEHSPVMRPRAFLM